jgi:hypothetical protein
MNNVTLGRLITFSEDKCDAFKSPDLKYLGKKKRIIKKKDCGQTS